MEGSYSVYFGNQPIGKVQVLRQGLYYRFSCRCKLTGNIICRLAVTCGSNRENLGIVVPMDGGFGLDTKLPVKRLGEGNMEFALVPKHETSERQFVAIYPEEPFAYITRLKNAYLIRQNGQLGILLREER